MFKLGDKIKVKAGVTASMLSQIGLCFESFSKGKSRFMGYAGNAYSKQVGEKGRDIVVDNRFYVSEAWIELAIPRGHHLTSIFK